MQNSTIRRSHAGVRISRRNPARTFASKSAASPQPRKALILAQPPIANGWRVEGHISASCSIDYPNSCGKLWMNYAIIMPRWISPATPLLVPTKERGGNEGPNHLLADVSSPLIARRPDLGKQPQPMARQQELCKQPPAIIAHCDVAHFSSEHDIVSCRACCRENVEAP